MVDEVNYNMSYKYNKNLVKNAQTLRKNMTREEKHLWYDFLKKLPITVHRQKNIENYIIDFYISKNRIAIELDGSQHYNDENQISDNIRDKKLSELGITVLRYSNRDINNHFYDVCTEIVQTVGLDVCVEEVLASSTASGPPSPRGEG